MINLTPIVPPASLALLPLLREADEDADRVRAALLAPAHTAYIAEMAGQPIGAAVLAWDAAASELLLLAVDPARRRQGHGQAIIAVLVAEARQRGTTALLVGTGNCSLSTIALYQRCGFRMDHVRRDYFAYVQPPVRENGILLQDMLVLRMDL